MWRAPNEHVEREREISNVELLSVILWEAWIYECIKSRPSDWNVITGV